MTNNALLQIGFYFVVLLALAKPLGAWMARSAAWCRCSSCSSAR